MIRPSKTCPICKKPVDKKYTPFCSKRCSEVDLGHWFGGRYKIPGQEKVGEEIKKREDQED